MSDSLIENRPIHGVRLVSDGWRYRWDGEFTVDYDFIKCGIILVHKWNKNDDLEYSINLSHVIEIEYEKRAK